LECVVLTGSYARGDYSETSDIDIWVFINDISEEDLRKIGSIVNKAGKRPEINPQCVSFAEFKSKSFDREFNPIQLYLDGIALYGALPNFELSNSEISSYASSIALFSLMSSRHYISVQEEEESLSKGKVQKWVLKPLMWALRYRQYSKTSNYPRSLENLHEVLSDNAERELVKAYLQILENRFKGSYSTLNLSAEKVAKSFLFQSN
jgi:hypothetical protein